MDVGFIGLGQMGSGMAANLVAAGHRATVWNRDPAKADRIGEMRPGAGKRGGHVTFRGTPADLMRDKDNVAGLFLETYLAGT